MAAPEGENDGEGAAVPATLAFAFSKTKTAARKLEIHEAERPKERRQLITGFQGSRAQTVSQGDEDDEDAKKVYIVPRLENTFKTGVGRRFVPSFRPPDNETALAAATTDDRFEAAALDTRPAVTGYGLETRARPGAAADPPAGPAPGLDHGHITLAQLEQQAYKEDMARLPEAPPTEAYESMPVEEFGRAMLLGMGWREGMGVGRNRKTAEPIEYLKRPERLGLGAQAAPMAPVSNKPVKMGDKPVVRREDLVLAPDADGRIRSVRRLDEQLVHRAALEPGARPGKTMCVVGGRHAGLSAVVLELLPVESGHSGRASCRLLPSQEVVQVRLKDLQDISNPQAHPSQQTNGAGTAGSPARGPQPANGARSSAPEAHHRDGRSGDGGERQGKRARERDDTSKGKHKSAHDRPKEETKRARKSRDASDSDSGSGGGKEGAGWGGVWLAPYIKVRVVDKRVGEGRLYLKKGTVVDVHPGKLCDVVLDEGRQTVQLRQRQLETVVPKDVGAAVLVVAGTLRGAKARLSAKSSAGACAVQLASDFTVHRLLLDQVAMYMGSLEDE